MRNETNATAATFQQGDEVEITKRNKSGESAFRATIKWTERRETGTYFGYEVDGPEGAFWGCATLRDVATPFGVTSVRVIGRKDSRPAPSWSPRPGDRGYDLCC